MSPLDHKGNHYSADTARPDAALASAARVATGTGSSWNSEGATSIEGFLAITAATAPTTLDVRLETSVDAGATWNTVAAFTQATGVTTKNHVFGPLGDQCRWAWTLVGTSFTFAITAEANY